MDNCRSFEVLFILLDISYCDIKPLLIVDTHDSLKRLSTNCNSILVLLLKRKSDHHDIYIDYLVQCFLFCSLS